jgi:hypothetical protein
MHWKSTEADGADGTDGDGSEYKVLEAVKMVRTCQNLSEQNGTHLGLLLLHVGPNGDGFAGQAFIEHYSMGTIIKLCPLDVNEAPSHAAVNEGLSALSDHCVC